MDLTLSPSVSGALGSALPVAAPSPLPLATKGDLITPFESNWCSASAWVFAESILAAQSHISFSL